MAQRVGKKLFEAADNNYYHNHSWSRESFIEGAKWEKKQILESACTAFCKVCDTHECGDYCECCWVENFRKQLKKEMRGC